MVNKESYTEASIAKLGRNLGISAQLKFLPIRIGKFRHEVALLLPRTDRPPSHQPILDLTRFGAITALAGSR